MKKGVIDISKEYALQYSYYEKDPSYKYFNRKFEIYLFKKGLKPKYVLHMDNCDTRPEKWAPHIHRAENVKKKLYFGVSTLNWNDIKTNFIDCVSSEIGENYRENIKKAVGKLSSPKI